MPDLSLRAFLASVPKSERTKYLFFGFVTFGSFAVIFIIFLVLSFFGSSANPVLEVTIRVLAALGGAFLTPITVQLFVAWVEEEKKPAQTAEFVASLFRQDDGRHFDVLTDETKGNLLKGILQSHTRGKKGDYGKALGDGLVKAYFGDDQSYRDRLTYSIHYKQATDSGFTFGGILEPFSTGMRSRAKHYHWIGQTITFDQFGNKSEHQGVTVRLLLDDPALRDALADGNLIFREAIHLLPQDMEAVASFSPQQLEAFVREVLEFSVEVGRVTGDDVEQGGRKDTRFTVAWANDKRRGIDIRIGSEPGETKGTIPESFNMTLAFRYPNRRNVSHFVYSAQRPVTRASISLAPTDMMKGLSFFPFTPRIGPKPYDGGMPGPNGISIQSNDRWWFPTTGFVFVWNPESID